MMHVQNDPKDIGACGCGRSPTGKCIGWHALSDTQYLEQLRAWEQKELSEHAQAQRENKENSQ